MANKVSNGKADVLVLGGGMMGVCVAYYLAERGSTVILVEKGTVGHGCSFANAGYVVPGHSMPLATPGIMAQGIKWMLNPESPFFIKPRWDKDLVRWLWQFRGACRTGRMYKSMEYLCELNRASMELYRELAREKASEFYFEQKGLLIVCKTQANMDAAIREVKDKEKLNIEAQVLNQTELKLLEPTIGAEVLGGVHFMQDGHLNSKEFVTGLAESAKKKGAVILEETEVIGWEEGGDKVRKVITTRGDFEAEQIVLATGAWSAGLMKKLGIKLLVQPAKGYSLTYKKPPVSPQIPMLLSETKVAITPLKDELRMGGTLELAGLNLTINRRRVGAIMKAVPQYLEGIDPANLELVELWRGLRPCSPDGVPIIDRSRRYENLVVACGHAMQGVSLGPITGKLVSQMLLGDKPMINLAPISCERFG